MKATPRVIEFIKSYEGFNPVLYKCPAGRPTIGYGHVIPTGLVESYNDIKINKYIADLIIKDDLRYVEATLNKINAHDCSYQITPNKFDALCSLVFNWGVGNFLKSKGCTYLKQRNYKQAEIEFFSREKGVVKIKNNFSTGLYQRRQKELKIWLG